MSDPKRVLPPDRKLFTSVTPEQPDGHKYCVDFLARDFDDAARICRMCGLSTAPEDLGEMASILEPTPDGPITHWGDSLLDGDEPT